jgi:MFS family permease
MGKSYLNKQTILLLGSLYTTQFVGFAFFSVAIVAIWRKAGMSLEQLGFVSLLSLVWVIKFLWAPWVDRYVHKQGGNYKKFLLLMQSLLVCAIAFVSLFDVIEDKTIIIFFLVLVGLLSATQDIAAEGLAYKILKKSERGFGGTLKTIGGIFGYIIGAGVALSIYEKIGWGATILLLALLSALTLLQLFFYQEHKTHNQSTNEVLNWRVFYRFWQAKEKKIWFGFLLLFPLGMSMANGLLIPLLVDIGWDLEKIGFIKGFVGSVLGIFSAFLSGWFLKYYSRKSVLLVISMIEVIGFLFLLSLHGGNTNIVLQALAIGTIFISYGASMPIISALIMDYIDNAPNTQYALQYALYTLFSIIANAGGVSLSGVFGYDKMIIMSSLFSLLTIVYVILFFKEVQLERD